MKLLNKLFGFYIYYNITRFKNLKKNIKKKEDQIGIYLREYESIKGKNYELISIIINISKHCTNISKKNKRRDEK